MVKYDAITPIKQTNNRTNFTDTLEISCMQAIVLPEDGFGTKKFF